MNGVRRSCLARVPSPWRRAIPRTLEQSRLTRPLEFARLLAGLWLLAIPGLGPVVAAGWLAATAVGAVAGAATGGLVGALVGAGVSETDAHVYSESVRRGGTLVSVRVKDEDAGRVQAILDRYKPVDPSVRAAEYRKEGWATFNPEAPPYRPSEAEIERIRRVE